MSDNRFAYGNLKTGQVVRARQKGTNFGSSVELEPDIDGPADPADWVPGVIGPDGKQFHPGDQSRKPPGGKWHFQQA
jgi:hypothetical protein